MILNSYKNAENLDTTLFQKHTFWIFIILLRERWTFWWKFDAANSVHDLTTRHSNFDICDAYDRGVFSGSGGPGIAVTAHTIINNSFCAVLLINVFLNLFVFLLVVAVVVLVIVLITMDLFVVATFVVCVMKVVVILVIL